MSRTSVSGIAAAAGAACMFACAPALAEIVFTGINTGQLYHQTAVGFDFQSSYMQFVMGTRAADDFNSVSIQVPGQSTPIVRSFRPVLNSGGSYVGGLGTARFFGTDANATVASMNASFPFGDYVLTANNTTTGLSQIATLNYDLNHWPRVPGNPGMTAIAGLTGAGYANVQGMTANLQHAIGLTNFFGNGIPLSPGEVTPSIRVSIIRTDIGQVVYNSREMPASTASFTLPANTLEANTAYSYTVVFKNGQHCGGNLTCGTGNAVGFFRDFNTVTSGQFTTAATSPIVPTTVNLQGGTLADPFALPHQGEIGQVNGTIGGSGAEGFYRFYWHGGQFKSNVVITGADPEAEFEFMLLDVRGNALENLALNQEDSFTADLSHFLMAGTYDIGIRNISDFLRAGIYDRGIRNITDFDPAFSITFVTPVQGIPEPGTIALVMLSAAGLALARGRKQSATPRRGQA